MRSPYRTFVINPRRSRHLDLLLVAACAAPLLIFAIGAYHWESWRGGFGFGMALAIAVPVVIAIWVDRVVAESAVLTVDAAGMRMESALPRWMGPQAGWAIRWDEVGRVGVLERFGLVQLQRHGISLMPVSVRVADWIEDVPGAVAPMSAGDFRQSTLWEALEAGGVLSARPDPRAQAANFDLAGHPATRLTLAVMGGLAAYWALDTLVGTEAWAEWEFHYIVPHFLVGAIAAGIGFFALMRASTPAPIPAPVVGVLAVFLGLTAGLSSWTGLLRLNQVVGGPLEQQAYVRNDTCDALLPVKPGLPPIEYTELASGYWCQFPRDRQHSVPVREGLFGLYQVDLSRHTEAIREFRRRARKE